MMNKFTKMNRSKDGLKLKSQLDKQQYEQQSLQEQLPQKQVESDKRQRLLQQIIQLREPQSNVRFIDKFKVPCIISLLDKNKLESIERIYRSKEDGFNILEFVRFFLNAIEHSQTETLYLTMGLVEFFKAISEANNSTDKIKFVHVTDYICNSILTNEQLNSVSGSSNAYSETKLDMKLIPSHKMVSPNYQIKPYLLNPPKIYGDKQQTVYKLSSTNTKVDKNKHDSVVTCCYFSYQYLKVFTLDSLSDSIAIYDTNCRLQRKLKPQNLKVKKDVVVLSFAYSQRQERLGAVMKDCTLSFWDFNDNLQFEKLISTASSCSQYQTNIWFLEYFNAWITCDKTGTIYIWNLQKQIPQRKIQCKFKGKINDVSEISSLNILAVAQQSRPNRLISIGKDQNNEAKIILYNYFHGDQVGEISAMTDMRIPHTLQYSETYQVLLSAGFEKKINIFEINHQYLDTNLKGQLLGHENLITNFILVRKTPMVVSCDDKGKVKVWDIRSYKCIQTLDFRDKTVISRLLDMVQIGKLGVLGSRINFLQYDEKQQIMKKYQKDEKNVGLNINYIYEENKLMVVTKKDIRLYDMQTGAIQRIYCDHHNRDEDIVVFKYFEFMNKILIANEKGEIKLLTLGGINSGDVENGTEGHQNIKCQQKLQGFANGVTHVEYDQDNKLFLTCGGNGNINIQKLITHSNNTHDFVHKQEHQVKDKFSTTNKKPTNYQQNQLIIPRPNEEWTVIRQMRGNFNNKDITVMAFSVYHGMIAIGSNCSEVYVWDYQYAKILFSIYLPSNAQPTAMTFINGFSLLLIAASNGELYFIKLLRLNEFEFQQQKSSQPKVTGPQHILTFKDNRTIKRKQQSLQISQQEDTQDCMTEILVDVVLKGTQGKSQTIEFAKLFIAYSSGKIAMIDVADMLRKQSFLPHRKTIPTYNPERQLKEQFSVELQKQKTLKIQIKPISQINVQNRNFPYPYQFLKPHSGSINSMRILQFDRHYLVTCGSDERIKVWSDFSINKVTKNKQGSEQLIGNVELLGDFNVNHPLPYLWKFSVKDNKKVRDKIMFSLKIIQSIFKKFGSDISTGQSKILKLQRFFKSLQKSNRKQNQYNYLTEPQYNEQGQGRKAFLFQQQFSKKDLHYDEIKKFNFYQIAGPSLRQLQFRKKMTIMQRQWQVAKEKQQQQKELLMSKIQFKAQKNQEKQQIINLLQDKRFTKNKVNKEEEDFPMVKRIEDQLKRVESQQQLGKDSRNTSTLLGGNNSLLRSYNLLSRTMIGRANNSMLRATGSRRDSKVNISMKDSKVIIGSMKDSKVNSSMRDTQKEIQQKADYGYLLRGHYDPTTSSKQTKTQPNAKTFQQYYSKKTQPFRNFQQQEDELTSRANKISTSHSKTNSFISQLNTRSVSHDSLRKRNDLLSKNTTRNHQMSFQNILKDMNNRVLLSRQGRTNNIERNRQKQPKEEDNFFQFPTERNKQTKRLTKTHYLNQQTNVNDKIN